MSKAKNLIRKILPTVLTVIGAGATVAATVLAAKEGPKFERALKEKEMTAKEKIVAGVKIFAPAAGCAAVSIACTVGAHCMDLHTQASITGAYIAVQEAYKKYRAKNEELNGPEADQKILTEIMTEEVPEEIRERIGNEPMLKFHDSVSGQDFYSTMANVIQAEYNVNKMITTLGACKENDWLEFLDIAKVAGGDDRGWSSDMLCDLYSEWWLDFAHYPSVDLDNEETVIIVPDVDPSDGYLSNYGLDC
ncbi:MAG: hypothetical protein E7576_06910 [Ruminococcaceae bacterium]|nr:hypothetical protein [Oscillospiraceae bacterium]